MRGGAQCSFALPGEAHGHVPQDGLGVQVGDLIVSIHVGGLELGVGELGPARVVPQDQGRVSGGDQTVPVHIPLAQADGRLVLVIILGLGRGLVVIVQDLHSSWSSFLGLAVGSSSSSRISTNSPEM